jgi:hypothetical protein
VEEKVEYEKGAQQAVSTPSTHTKDVLTGVKVQAGYVHVEARVSENVDKTVRNIPLHSALGADPAPVPTPDDARWAEVDVPSLFPGRLSDWVHESDR